MAHDIFNTSHGFRMAVERFSKPPPRDKFECIVREAHARLDKLLKHTHVRISRLSAQDAQALLRN